MLHHGYRRKRGPNRSRKAAALLALSTCLFSGVMGLCALGFEEDGTPAAATAPGPFLNGAYVGAANVSGLASFASATDTTPTLASDSLPYSGGWAGVDGANGSLDWELKNGWSGTHYVLSLAVPMIPTDASGVAEATLADGARGTYNQYFTALARTLIAAGEADAYLRLGWEFDGGAYAWSATDRTAEADFAAYFRQIVTAIRSVPGEQFRFVWNPTATAFTDDYNLALAYPGNAFVNVIGLDDYDQTWLKPHTSTVEWNETTLPNLTAAHLFAVSHRKPLAVCEWGLSTRTDGHGLGDDPSFIDNFVAWMKNPVNDVQYESYFNFSADGQDDSITQGDTPKSLAAFAADLGQTSQTTDNELRDIIIGIIVVSASFFITVGLCRRRRRATPLTGPASQIDAPKAKSSAL
jgi:Glycosyl hydrolase family 26